VLQFGGGKDSLACLYLLKPQWDDITVVWLNTGAAFPESLALMEQIRREVPHFREVKVDVDADIARNGYPVDVLPVNATEFAQNWSGVPVRMRAYTDCCLHNMWAPLQQFTMMLKPDAIIRGQRLSEKYKSTLRDGDVMGGVRYEFPIQEWSEQDVFNFLNRSGIEIPDYYRFTQTSLDCWTCTAYLDAKQGQLQYMKQFHPDKHAVVMERLHRIAAITEGQTAHLRQAISHGH